MYLSVKDYQAWHGISYTDRHPWYGIYLCNDAYPFAVQAKGATDDDKIVFDNQEEAIVYASYLRMVGRLPDDMALSKWDKDKKCWELWKINEET